MMPQCIASSGEIDIGATQILALKSGAETEIELDNLRETWKNFKIHLLESTPKTLATMVQSLFLIELQSHILNSGFENDLGLPANELKNLDNFIARFEDYCIPRILLKFQKFQALSLQYELAGSNLSHENGYLSHENGSESTDIKQQVSGSALTDISGQKLACSLQAFEASKANALFMISDKKVKKIKMSTASPELMCDNSIQPQSEQAALVLPPEASNVSSVMRKQKCQETETGNEEFVSFDDNNSCNSAEILRENSLQFQPSVKNDIKLGNAFVSDPNSNHLVNKSQTILRRGRIIHTDNQRPMRNVKEVFCSVCGFQCKNSRELTGHIQSHVDKNQQHKYLTCKKVIKQRTILKSRETCMKNRLEQERNSDSNIILGSASKQYSNSRHLRNEKPLKHSFADCKRPFSCKICIKSSSVNINGTKSQRKSNTIYKQLKCEICQRIFQGTAKLKRHKLTHSGEKPCSCKVCGTAFADKSHLNVHLCMHSGEKPFKCDICESAFSESTKLKNHKRVHTGEKPFVCEICGSAFSVSSSLRSHMKIHSGERPYKCNLCEFASAHSSNLKAHLMVHTGEKKFPCDKCGASFTETAKLKRHKMVHTGEKPYSCEVCGARFADKSHLTVHLRIHSGEKPFKCTFCTSAFVESSKLKNHLRIHTGEKPYVCEICGISFAVSYSLKSHMRRHTGEKPYKCDICGYATSQSSNLKTHMVVHNGTRPHICEVCGASFSEPSKLNRHSIIHIDQKEETSTNHLSLDENSDGLDQIYLKHLQTNYGQKQNTNWQKINCPGMNSVHENLSSVSYENSCAVTNNNQLDQGCEVQYRNIVQPFHTSLATADDGSSEVGSSITGIVKLLEQTNVRISDETFHFASLYKGDHISDSTLHIDLGNL